MNSNEIGVGARGTRTNTDYSAATALYAVASIVVFIVTMAINNCPANNLGFQGDCLAEFLGRFSFQPFQENPLLGPSSYTNSVSVGASGVLFGLIGAMLSEVITNWTLHSNKVMTLLPLLVISVANLVVGIFPHADNMVHIGGLLVGILAGFILLPRPQYGELEPRHIHAGVPRKAKYRVYQLVLGIISLTLLITGLSIALVTLFRGGNVHDHCNWCHYLTCVPSSKWDCSYED
ncbi:inactive rhomboid protein 1-like [Trifolium medium]|uniref:RHOMBOID-like protein n=1 Tax=Trifolium medium TaxID=97028 RepID=A0A392MA48_9FABA|nr:inactive rhomboid protein 1-like [Trifolium medium]